MKIGEMSRDGLAGRIEELETERGRLTRRVAELEASLSECVKAMDGLLGDSDPDDWDESSPTAVMARAVDLIT